MPDRRRSSGRRSQKTPPKKFELSTELMERAYELVAHTSPFDRWNMPPPDEVVFRTTRSKNTIGDYHRDGAGRHIIRGSVHLVGSLFTLIALMSHEMIHLHQCRAGMLTSNPHDAAFHKLADQVCAIHGFDRRAF